MALDFGLGQVVFDHVYVRYRPDSPGYVLVRNRREVAIVDRLLLHIDFRTAEMDAAAQKTGPTARGTGVLQFNAKVPPHIVDRDITLATNNRLVGFVLDIASPYAIGGVASHAVVKNQVFASSFPGARESMADAYRQYVSAREKNCVGVPVYDTYGWITTRTDGVAVHKPRLCLVGFVASLSMPLELVEQVRLRAARREYMARYRLDRPRLGVITDEEMVA